MSAISEKLKEAEEIFFLVELDFDGWLKRISTDNVDIKVSVGEKTAYQYIEWDEQDVIAWGASGTLATPILAPIWGGDTDTTTIVDTNRFEGLINKNFAVGNKFDIRNFKYSYPSVKISMNNKERFQDEEVKRRLDGGKGKIYLWCDGLEWDDISTEGILFNGLFSKDSHDTLTYNFSITDQSKFDLKQLPVAQITSSTWASHKTTNDGGGSVAGKYEPMIFGNHSLPYIPLLNVDTGSHKYLLMYGASLSTSINWMDGNEYIVDKYGATVATSDYTQTLELDAQGNLTNTITFSSNMATLEPLGTTIKGYYDGTGEYTGIQNTLIEHPGDIYHYVLNNYSNLTINEINKQDIKTMKSIIPNYKYSSIINGLVYGSDYIDKLFSPIGAGRLIRTGGKIGLMILDPDGKPTWKIDADTQSYSGTMIKTNRTPDDLICNELQINYNYSPINKGYNGILFWNKDVNSTLKKSFDQYGKRPLVTLNLPDIKDQQTIIALAQRYIKLRAFRHDLLPLNLLYSTKVYDMKEGDIAKITFKDGPSRDGNGWVDENFILLDKTYTKQYCITNWWRINTD